jgi:phosphate starvation-inducible membrane PsiE
MGSGDHMNILTMLQYLTLTLFALNAAFGLARAIARGTTRAFAHECGESLMMLFLLAEMLRSFDLI